MAREPLTAWYYRQPLGIVGGLQAKGSKKPGLTIIQQQGDKFCQQPNKYEGDSSPTKPPDENAARQPLTYSFVRSWAETSQAVPRLLTQETCEI